MHAPIGGVLRWHGIGRNISVAYISDAGHGVVMTVGTIHQTRLRALGLTQVKLAAMLGLSANTVSRQFRGEWEMPAYIPAFLIAWEMLTGEQRDWLYSALAPDNRAEGETPMWKTGGQTVTTARRRYDGKAGTGKTRKV